VRISTAGAVLDATDLPIAHTTADEVDPYVTSDGTNFLVVWSHLQGTTRQAIDGVRINSAGTILDPTPITINAGPLTLFSAAAAWNGTTYLVVWESPTLSGASRIVGARVTPAGTVSDPLGIPIRVGPGCCATPAVASDKNNFLVIWTDGRSGTNADIYGTRVSNLGVVLDTDNIPIATTPRDEDSPSVAWNGSYLAVWRDDDRNGPVVPTNRATRLAKNGTVTDANGFSIEPFASGAAAVTAGPTNKWGTAAYSNNGGAIVFRTVAPK
jgi:hypothetical protein